MRLLLDECLPRPHLSELEGIDAHFVNSLGWKGLKNGALIAQMAAAGFTGMLTVDRNMNFQQNFRDAELFIVLLVARSNRLSDLLPLMPAARRVLGNIKPREFVQVGRPGT